MADRLGDVHVEAARGRFNLAGHHAAVGIHDKAGGRRGEVTAG